MGERGSAVTTTQVTAWLALTCLCISGCSNSQPDELPNLEADQTTPDLSAPAARIQQAAVVVVGAKSSADEVPIEADGGTFLIPVTINDTISLKFTIDSGAADVTIPSDVAATLIRAGTISASDYVGSQTFVLADGSEVPSPEFRIHSLRVGKLVLHDVVATITGASGSLLLGQSFLRQLKSWSIDNDRRVLMIQLSPSGQGAAAANGQSAALPDPVEASSGTKSDDPVLASSAVRIVRDYFSAWSNSADPEGLGVGRYYGDPVSFYGKSMNLNELMSTQKLPFAKRWPLRTYTPTTMHTRCDTVAGSCTVIGNVRWRVSTLNGSRHSSGIARFSLLLSDGRIVGEGGRVLSRD